MFSILRPFLFNLDPETAHDLAIKSLKFNPLPSKMFEVEDEQMLKNEVAMCRLGTVQEVSASVVFLASMRAAFITGANLVVDGGQTRGL